MKSTVANAIVEVAAHIVGPPVVECFGCDAPVPIAYIRWLSELSEHGRVTALLPYCEQCVAAREANGRRDHCWR